ncbi:hypothetical protein TNCV_1175621 [Trichonephila clavipes]|nr:hypothetical protein TNCV_1175621 [Trichonephila clavipes]
MVSCSISCQICSNSRARSSAFSDRHSRLLIIFQIGSIGEKSGWPKKCLTSCKTVHSNTRDGCGLALYCWKKGQGAAKGTVEKQFSECHRRTSVL